MKTGGGFDHAGSDDDARVLAFVRLHPATRLGAIVDALSLKPWRLRPVIDRLLAAKHIVVGGSGRGQRVSAKEEP